MTKRENEPPFTPVLPPRDIYELAARARAIAGRSLTDLAAAYGLAFLGRAGAHTKGKAGQLVERLLGATGGSAKAHDFPDLGVELKTVPVDEARRPRESTYVCTLSLADADRAEWATSWVRQKLSHVLWVPLEVGARDVRVLDPIFWVPTDEQLAVLASDFDDVMGKIALGGIETLTARTGRWLQVRPKGANGRARTWAIGAEDAWVETMPRGFYLRTSFTGALLKDGEKSVTSAVARKRGGGNGTGPP